MISYTIIINLTVKKGYKQGNIIFAVNNDIKYMKLLLDALGDIFSFFWFLIYLEVFKLDCY